MKKRRPASLFTLLLCAIACDDRGTPPHDGGAAGGAGLAHPQVEPKTLEECIAPCLHELFSACQYEEYCIEDQRSENPDHVVLCEPETGWRFELDDLGAPYKIWVTRDGALCFGLDPGPDRYDYRDGNGDLVGSWRWGDGPGKGTGTCAGDETEYPHDSVSPGCAEFFEYLIDQDECRPGTCRD